MSLHFWDRGPRLLTTRGGIIDIHEHLDSEEQAKRLLPAMDQARVARTCLVGSSLFTLTSNPAYGFEGFRENNETLLAIKRRWPQRFCVFVTLDPSEPDSLDALKTYVASGADGLKLYAGHTGEWGNGHRFHTMRLDDPRLELLFNWAERTSLPIIMHVNLTAYGAELSSVLRRHPQLWLDLPHFGISLGTPDRLSGLGVLLDSYPHIYTDISFGQPAFQLTGFEILSRTMTQARHFVQAHHARLLFGADMVLTAGRTDSYVTDTLLSYRQMLEHDSLSVAGVSFTGLNVGEDILRDIYEGNPGEFLRTRERSASRQH